MQWRSKIYNSNGFEKKQPTERDGALTTKIVWLVKIFIEYFAYYLHWNSENGVAIGPTDKP